MQLLLQTGITMISHFNSDIFSFLQCCYMVFVRLKHYGNNCIKVMANSLRSTYSSVSMQTNKHLVVSMVQKRYCVQTQEQYMLHNSPIPYQPAIVQYQLACVCIKGSTREFKSCTFDKLRAT